MKIKKRTKRLIAFMLSVMMCASLLSVSALAEESTSENEEDVVILTMDDEEKVSIPEEETVLDEMEFEEADSVQDDYGESALTEYSVEPGEAEPEEEDNLEEPDDGIVLLDDISAGTVDEFKEAIEDAEAGDTVTLTEDITVDCTDEDFVKINTAGITVDLGGNTINVTGSSDSYYLFDIVCGGEFTLKNGTIDGGEDNAKVAPVQSFVASNDVTLDGVTIQNIGSVSTSNGGVVHATAGNLTLTNCKAQNNGVSGIYADGCDNLVITDSTFSGNNASNGGGIFIRNHKGNICIKGNIVSNNTVNSDGGGIYIFESASSAASGDFAVTDNVISGNTAGRDGGGIYFRTEYYVTASDSVGDFDLSGNTITQNKANSGYGGGIELLVDVEGRAVVIKSGIIAKNSAYWGGGIDSSYSVCQSVLHLYNAVITGNEAGFRGGGIWACPSSETTMNVTFGAAIYGNTATGRISAWTYGPSGDDIRFEGYNTDAVNTGDANGYAYVSERALGGTLMDWYADDDSRGNRYEKGADRVDVTSERYTGHAASFGLHGELSDEGISLAEEDALLYITGNTSETVGGGIATNTPVEFGEATSLTVKADKIWKEKDGETDLPHDEIKDYSVDVTLIRIDESGTEVDLETVTLNAENEWSCVFRDLPTGYMSEDSYEEHSYIYTIRESNVRTDGFFDVSVDTGEVSKNEDGTLEQTVTVTNIRREEPEPETRDISGSKTWDDDDDKADARPKSITVNLYQNDELYDSMTVTESDNWTWSWTGLPKTDENGEDYVYTIDEDEVEYYTPTYYTDGNFNITNTFVGEEGAEHPTPGPDKGGDTPKTGDTNHLGLWIALLVAAIAAALVALRLRKRVR